MFNLILASKSKVRKEILNKNNISCIVEPSNVDEDLVKESLLNEGATPEIVSKNLSARSVELLVRNKKGPQKSGQLKMDSNILNEQNKIQEILGLNVNIQNKKNNSGKITILYKNLDQFELISNLLKKQ